MPGRRVHQRLDGFDLFGFAEAGSCDHDGPFKLIEREFQRNTDVSIGDRPQVSSQPQSLRVVQTRPFSSGICERPRTSV